MYLPSLYYTCSYLVILVVSTDGPKIHDVFAILVLYLFIPGYSCRINWRPKDTWCICHPSTILVYTWLFLLYPLTAHGYMMYLPFLYYTCSYLVILVVSTEGPWLHDVFAVLVLYLFIPGYSCHIHWRPKDTWCICRPSTILVHTWLFLSYPLTAQGYMMYLPSLYSDGAHSFVSGSCSLPMLWPNSEKKNVSFMWVV